MIFCGIPGSGKTTLAHLVTEAMGNAVHVQTDTIRFMMSAPKYTWEEARFVYESAFLIGREALKRGYDAVLDGTFLREDYRQEALARLSGHYSSAAVVCVTCRKETARARNSSRNPAVPEESFDRLVKSFELPEDGIIVRTDARAPSSCARYVLRRLSKLPGWEDGRAT